MTKRLREIEEIATKCSCNQSDGYAQIMRICESMKTAYDYFKVGDIVDMHCGEQGIVVEILDDDWVNLLQCDGHVDRAYISDIWPAETKQNGKEALHEFFMKTLGYSSICEEESSDNDSECTFLPPIEGMEEPPF